MKASFAAAFAVGMCLCHPVLSDHLNSAPGVSFGFPGLSEGVQHGLLIGAPNDTSCHRARYRVLAPDLRLLGQTGSLAPGKVALVPLGGGFGPGEVRVTVVETGCGGRPASLRWVRLNKASPDHGTSRAKGPQPFHEVTIGSGTESRPFR